MKHFIVFIKRVNHFKFFQGICEIWPPYQSASHGHHPHSDDDFGNENFWSSNQVRYVKSVLNSGQSYKQFALINYDSRVILTSKLLIFTTLDS